MNLEVQVDGAFLGVALNFDGLVFFNLVEEVQLIQPQDADFPSSLVEELAFIEQQFTANYFIARGGVSDEIDSANVVLLLFIELQGQVDDFGVVVNIEFRFRSEVDEAIFTIDTGVILHAFAKLGNVENFAFLKRKSAFQSFYFQRKRLIGVGAYDSERAHVELWTFFDGNGDVDRFAGRFSQHRHRHAELVILRVDIFEDRLLHQHVKVTVVLIHSAHTNFQVFVQLVPVVGLGQYVDLCDVQRNLIGTVMLHGSSPFAVAEGVVAGKFDLANLDFRPFIDFEDQNDRVAGSDAFVLRTDFRKLPTVFAHHLLFHHFHL